MPRPMRTAALHALMAVLAFALTCVALRQLAPFPQIPQVADKLRAFTAGRGHYNAVFLGSSRIYSGIVPRLFDEKMSERGMTIRSFNFGIDGMGFPESGYLCDEVLARSAGTLRWVFIELAGIRTTLDGVNAESRRLQYWRDLPRTAVICRSLMASRAEPRGSTAFPALLSANLSLSIRRFVNHADGAELLRDLLIPPPRSTGRDAFEPAAEGYCPMTKQLTPALAETYQRNLAQLSAERVRGDAVSESALQDLVARVGRAGATAIFLVPPNSTPGRRFFTGDDAAATPLFAFDDPARFPTLYQTEYRSDPIHLNDSGARAFTEALCQRFAAFLDSTRAPSR